jgi:hypothetical protein
MTQISTSCPVCGPLLLRPAQLTLVVCSVSARSFYAFTCMTCGEAVQKLADVQAVADLTSAGVAIERWVIPPEALERHLGAAITYDDVLDFALSLDGVDLLAAMAHPRIGAWG